ncbi:hypothetical protein [Pseudomonas serbica]|uniref:hypothetical protein n=1 Tax=Pseudomonas serbica TaxID=2965074 RepID=UPI00237B4C25|nr:hypothetical protein [Pseudomonas serbica]
MNPDSGTTTEADVPAQASKTTDTDPVYIVNGREQSERPVCVIRDCERFADSPWTTCQEHWR